MDYIREELLRQRAALARLLLGGSGEEPQREEEELSAGEETFRFSRVLAGENRMQREQAELRTAEGEGWNCYDGLEAAPEVETVRLSVGADASRKISRPAQAQMERKTVPYRSRAEKREGAVLRFAGDPETVLPGMMPVTEILQSSDRGETASARQLSRTIQRDARRYNGGFTLY